MDSHFTLSESVAAIARRRERGREHPVTLMPSGRE